MKTHNEYFHDKYGTFIISQGENGFVIWWSFYSDGEADMLNSELEFIPEECDITDFSDVPDDGIFQTNEEAYNFLVIKFGSFV